MADGILDSIKLDIPDSIMLPGDHVLNLKSVDKVADQVVLHGSQLMIDSALAISLIVASWIAVRWIYSRMHRALVRAHVEETFASFLSSVVMYGLFLFSVLVALNILGVSNASLVAVFGAAALAIGFALRGTLTHVASGIMLMTNRPFRVGDWIEMDNVSGTVKRITLFVTEVNTLDNKRVFIPNTKLWEGSLLNHTYANQRMIELRLTVGYASPAARVLAVLRASLADDTRILTKPEAMLGVDALGDNGAVYLLRFWVKTSQYSDVRYDILARLWADLAKNGMEIAPARMAVQQDSPFQNARNTAKKGK